MKHVKKLFAMLMAVMMLVGLLSVTSFAEDTYKLTIKNTTVGHTYDVYQIFTGDLSNKTLSNIKYGANYVPTGKNVGDVVPATELSAITDADVFAASVVVTGTAFKSSVASADKETVVSGLPAGYYLVKESSATVPDGEAYTKFMLQIVGDAEVTVKSGTTFSEKKVKDVNDSEAGSLTGWQDSADYDIGDQVPFQLKATICNDYANYTKGYKLTFHDKESAGLTFNEDSVKVYVDGKLLSSGYTVTYPATDGDTFDVSFANLKEVVAADETKVEAGSVITVEYTSELNSSAVIGSTGNPNEMHITYTNNPNDTQVGENGKTPNDKVIVFTYKVVVNKVDSEKKALPGAEFTLYKKNVKNEYVEVTGKLTKNAAGTEFTWTGIDDGDYKLVETTTPAGYNTAADILFTVTADHQILSDDPLFTELKGGNMFTGEVDTDNNPTGILSGDVVNNAGSTLPETGGIGTYIFYAVGGVLVLAAVVLFVTKKRMSNAD